MYYCSAWHFNSQLSVSAGGGGGVGGGGKEGREREREGGREGGGEGVEGGCWEDGKRTRWNSSHVNESR